VSPVRPRKLRGKSVPKTERTADFPTFWQKILWPVLLALFSGIFLGATILNGYDPLQGIMHALDTYLINALTDPDHVAIVIFSMTLGGMVGVISRSGGTRGIVEKITKYANHRRRGILTSWALGILIFFDILNYLFLLFND